MDRITRSLLSMLILWILGTLSGFAQTETSLYAVVDAGSTGSRVYVYDVDPDHAKPVSLIYTQSVEGGISDGVAPGAMRSMLDKMYNLLSGAAQAIQHDHPDVAQVPLYVYSTAGMRLVPPGMQLYINIQLTQMIQSRLPIFQRGLQVKTISGASEGLYGWLAINYLDKRIGDGTHQPTVGLLDLGGASSQIVFALSPESKQKAVANEEVDIFGRRYAVVSMSFLGTGQTGARQHVADPNACFPDGYEHESIQGDYNQAVCAATISQYLDQFALQHVRRLIPPFKMFYGISGFYYDMAAFDVPLDDATVATLDQNRQALCDQGVQAFDMAHNPYAAYACFNAAYASNLLKGYGIGVWNGRSANGLRVAKKINGTKVTWTLGVVLDRVYRKPVR